MKKLQRRDLKCTLNSNFRGELSKHKTCLHCNLFLGLVMDSILAKITFFQVSINFTVSEKYFAGEFLIRVVKSMMPTTNKQINKKRATMHSPPLS